VSGPALALVVCAAILHAVWNALAKRADNQFVFLWCSVSLATALLLPLGQRVPGRVQNGGAHDEGDGRAAHGTILPNFR